MIVTTTGGIRRKAFAVCKSDDFIRGMDISGRPVITVAQRREDIPSTIGYIANVKPRALAVE